MKKIVTSILVAFFVILLLPFAQVHAYGSTFFNLPASPRYGHPQLISVHLDNGLYCYVYADESQDVFVEIYNSLGVHQAQVTYDVEDSCAHYADLDIQRLSVIAIDDDEILISMVVLKETADRHHNVGVARVHTETYTVNKYWDTEQAIVGGTVDMFTSQIFQSGTNFYGIVTTDVANDGAHEQWRWRFESATNTYSSTRDTVLGGDLCGQIFGFQDSADNTSVYLIGSVEADENRTVACKWDLDSYTTEPEKLANAPFDTDWYFVDQSGYDPETQTRLNLRYIGGDAFYNATTDKYYVYHTWTKGQYGQDGVEVKQWRLQFNSSGIDSLYLEANNRLTNTQNPATGFPTDETAIFGGLLNSKTSFYMYCENRYAVGDYRCYRYEYQITDWETFGSSVLSRVDNEWYDEIIQDDYNNIGYKDPESTMQFGEEYDESLVTVYYGLDPDAEGYDVSWTYTPYDDPPEINKRYSFTGITTLNEIAYQCEVTVYVDDITITSRETSTSGVFTFWLQTSVLGAHNLTVELFDDGESEYAETVIYVFVESTEDTDTQLTAIGIGGMMNFVILFALCGAPAYLLMREAGTMGFFAGLGLGAVIGYVGGVMPMYGLFLVGLICAVGIIYGRRQTQYG